MFRYLAAASTILIATASAVAYAQAQTIGDWKVDIQNPSVATATFTANNAGASFGLMCIAESNKCIFYLLTKTACTPGSTTAIFINAKSGKLFANATCMEFNGQYMEAMEYNSELTNIVLRDASISASFVAKDGAFEVFEFSFNGAKSAIGVITTAMRGSERKP